MTRHYTIEQIETYEVEANSVEEAMEIVSNWDNSYASKVERRGVFAGGELTPEKTINDIKREQEESNEIL
jgi:hypothetical protein